jgi:hypothetical protein
MFIVTTKGFLTKFFLVVGVIFFANVLIKLLNPPIKRKGLVRPLPPQGEDLLRSNLENNENIRVKLSGVHGQALIITDKRIFILKWGYKTTGGSGGRCLVFSSEKITAIDFEENLNRGMVEILTPATQNAQKNWMTAMRSDNIVCFENDLESFREAVKMGRSLIESHSKSDGIKAKSSDLSQIEELAKLKDKGILTNEEFEAKKKQILGL